MWAAPIHALLRSPGSSDGGGVAFVGVLVAGSRFVGAVRERDAPVWAREVDLVL